MPIERASKLTCYIIIVRFLDSKRRKIAFKRTVLCAGRGWSTEVKALRKIKKCSVTFIDFCYPANKLK